MSVRFQDKVVVITGASTGIGRATAIRFAGEGARLVLAARNPEKLAETQKLSDPKALIVPVDLGSPEGAKTLAAKIKEHHDKVDGLFVNAGMGIWKPFTQTSPDDYDTMMNVNLKGAFFTIQSLLPFMSKGSSIVMNSSVTSEKGFPNSSVYSMTKAGLRSLARVLASELAGQGIRVNTVSPGPIETPFFENMGLSEKEQHDMAAGVVTAVPMNRFGSPDEVAQAVLFLCSNESSYISGSQLSVDGGLAQV